MSTASQIIAISEGFSEHWVRRLREVGQVITIADHDRAGWMDVATQCEAMIVRSQAKVDAELIRRAPRLRVIGRAGVGLENIDLEVAQQADVVVVYTPHASTEAVAEFTVGLVICLQRSIHTADSQARQDQWNAFRRSLRCCQLSKQTVGIIGFGRIGQRVGQLLNSTFQCRILYNDIIPIKATIAGARNATKEEIYKSCDVVSLHVPLTDTTRGLIDDAALSQMKPNAVLVNTSRGAVVQTPSLASALQEGTIAGAALDVLPQEPPAHDDPILSAPNCLITPHIAARTTPSLAAMEAVVEDVIGVMRGLPPVNAAYPASPRTV